MNKYLILMRFIIVFRRKDVCIMFTKEKFEEMDNFIRDFENISDEDRSKFFNKELNSFIDLTEVEKIIWFNRLMLNSVMNKCLCIEKTKMAIECYRNILSVIKKAVIDNTDIDVVLRCIDKFDFCIFVVIKYYHITRNVCIWKDSTW